MNTLALFKFSILFIHIAYVAAFFGIAYINQTYVRYFSTFIQFVVSLFLIIRFSPFKKTYEITKLDVSIIFYCATFLLLNVFVTEIYENFLKKLQVVQSIEKDILHQTK